MRNLSSTVLEAIYADNTSKVFVHLIEIDHADLSAPIRLADNTENVVSRSNTYTAFPFRLAIPPDNEGELPRVRLTIDNVSQEIIADIRALASPPDITLEVVLADDADTVEVGPYPFKLKTANYDQFLIESTVGYEEDFLAEPIPQGRFTPTDFPGLFNALS